MTTKRIYPAETTSDPRPAPADPVVFDKLIEIERKIDLLAELLGVKLDGGKRG